MSATSALAFRRFNTGGRNVMAFHCSLAHSGVWKPLATALDGQANILAPDMLSHGRSPDWQGPGDFLDRMLHETLALWDAEIDGEPVDLVGHSFGAVLALALAAARPERVQSLLMIEPVFFAVASLDAPELVAQMDRDGAETNAAFAARDWPLAARRFNREWSEVSLKWDDMPRQMQAALIRAVPIVPDSYDGVSADSQKLLSSGVLDAVTSPAAVLYGEKSYKIMEVVAQGIAKRLPNAHCQKIDGAGHMLPLTHGGHVVKVLGSLWR